MSGPNCGGSSLEAVGLKETMKKMCVDFQRRVNFDIDFESSGDQVFPKVLQITLYRFLQEASNNIVKHSGATRGEVQLDFDSKKVNISVQDNGKCFEYELVLAAHDAALA